MFQAAPVRPDDPSALAAGEAGVSLLVLPTGEPFRGPSEPAGGVALGLLVQIGSRGGHRGLLLKGLLALTVDDGDGGAGDGD